MFHFGPFLVVENQFLEPPDKGPNTLTRKREISTRAKHSKTEQNTTKNSKNQRNTPPTQPTTTPVKIWITHTMKTHTHHTQTQKPTTNKIFTFASHHEGGVRGIATGCSLRRLVARTLARQFAQDFEKECAPFQYALSSRAGTDCVRHMLHAAIDADPAVTILSVDGTYDHVFRSAMLERLEKMPKARVVLPFVRSHTTIQLQLVGCEG